MFLRHRLAAVTLVSSMLVANAGARAASATVKLTESAPRTDAERALQERLIAPCCWTQTLDVHASDISTQLRAEIRTRLARGDAADAIEDDFAARFGERIRALPKGKDPLRRVPFVVGGAMLASAFGLVLVLRRWARRGDPVEEPSAPLDAPADDYDQRLDDELRRLDG